MYTDVYAGICCSVWHCIVVCMTYVLKPGLAVGMVWLLCCSVLQCVAVRGSMWQCVAVCLTRVLKIGLAEGMV